MRPGTITAGLARIRYQGRVIGIDQSQCIVEDASQSHPSVDWSNLSFKLGNVFSGEGFNFPNASFDIVFTSNVIIHVPEPIKAIKEAYRLLKLGDILAMREADTADWYPDLPSRELYQRAMNIMVQRTGAPGLDSCRAVHT
jgi:ubiquinone/menaquinone biosynthesis C-methylase UbiE